MISAPIHQQAKTAIKGSNGIKIIGAKKNQKTGAV
jgi:hypothetical protein